MNMKNFRILLFVAAASLFAACNDAIDITQPSELLPENTYETVNDMQLGLNGAYLAAPGEDEIKFTSLFTDEVKLGIANGGQGRDGELGFTLNTTSEDAENIWRDYYYLINLSNRLIKGGENVTPTTDEETAQYNNILAQAYFLRAYGHFKLLSFFSPDMTDDNALGAILVDFVPTITQDLPRSTNGEVFALIENDLAFAEANIDDALVGGVYVNKIGASKRAITALRARMALYRGQFDLAGSYVDALGTLVLASRTTNPVNSNYIKMFYDTDQSEVIWQLQRSIDDATGNFYQIWASVNSSVSGSPFFEVGTALFDKIAPGDIRRYAVVDPSAAPGYNVKPVGKYSGTGRSQNLLGNIKVFRNSEMVLIKAETFANLNDFTNVAAQINKIRAARFGNATGNIPVPTSSQEAWAAILNERRIELAFEGHRYIDLERLGAKAGVGVDRNLNDYSFNGIYTLPLDDYRWTLPVPRAERAANPNIQQNPGY
jgi:hypothetical protein